MGDPYGDLRIHTGWTSLDYHILIVVLAIRQCAA